MKPASPCYILGISSGYHDSAAALLRDGELVAAIAEERLSHLKHDASFPKMAIEWCLKQAGIPSAALSGVVYYEIPSAKFLRIVVSALSAFPQGFRFFADAMQRWLPSQLWVKTRICSELGIDPSQVSNTSHHLSHACHAFFNSPFDRAAVLTVDAVGEWACTSIAVCDRSAASPVRIVYEQTYPSSLGLFYAAMTAFLGFQPNSDECSTMALAAYGRPVYRDALLQLLSYDPAEPGRLDLSHLDVQSFLPSHFSQPLAQLVGAPRDMRHPLPFDCLKPDQAVDADAQRFADVAASVQAVLMVVVQDLADKAQVLAGTSVLCLAGGVANNCVIVGELVRQRGSDKVFVPLDPGDAGSAIGAAQAGDIRIRRALPQAMTRAGVGADADEAILPALLAEMVAGSHPQTSGLAWHTHDSDDALVEAVARRIADGELVGWVQGPCEFGPRALGSRSILVHPAHHAAVARLGREVKPRAPFRPYGVSVTEAFAHHVLGMPAVIPQPARWMQMAVSVPAASKAGIMCTVAVDGTTRPQVCCPQTQPLFHHLLEAVGRQTGTEAVLNTSFNMPGFPMVATSLDALTAAIHMRLDYLVIGRTVIHRRSSS